MADDVEYEAGESPFTEVNLRMLNGNVKENFSFLNENTVSDEISRICQEENVGAHPNSLHLVLTYSQGQTEVAENDRLLKTYDLHSCSLVELELKSNAQAHGGRSSKPEKMNYTLKS